MHQIRRIINVYYSRKADFEEDRIYHMFRCNAFSGKHAVIIQT